MQEPDQTESKPDENIPKKPTKSRYWALLTAIIALILALLSLALQFFFLQLHQKNLKFIAAQSQQLATSLAPKINSLYEQMDNQQKSINTLLSRDQSGTIARRNAILLAQEAEYLLSIAQYNLLYGNNTELASKLLAEADQKLQEMNDSGVTSLRKLISSALTELSLTPKVDVASIISRLAAINNQIPTLSELPAVPATTQPEAKPTINQGWKEKLMAILQSLRGILSIRRLPEPITPLASPEQQANLVGKIQLQLSQAQWAVLYQNEMLYQKSLEQAKKQLQTFYAKNPQGNHLIQMLSELQQVNIKPKVPDLTNILSMLRNYIHEAEASFETMMSKPNNITQQITTNSSPRVWPS